MGIFVGAPLPGTLRISISESPIAVRASCQHHLYTADSHQMVLHRPVECTPPKKQLKILPVLDSRTDGVPKTPQVSGGTT